MAQNILRIGLDYAAPIPLHTDLSSGHFEGFEVDLMNEVAGILGMTIQHSVALWRDIEDDLANGKLDAVCSAATVTEERMRKVAFSEPYLTFHLCVVCSSDQSLTAAHLSGKTVGVRTKTEAESWLQARYPGQQFKVFDSNDEQYGQLVRREVDALVDDSPIAFGFASKGSAIKISELIGDTFGQYAIMLNKDNVELKERVDGVIEHLKSDGYVAERQRRWFKGAQL